MPDILHVNHGYTLHETAPTEYNYAYQDSQSTITRNVGSPLSLGFDPHGNFATFSGGLWQEGRDFEYDGISYDSFQPLQTPDATFWSWTDSAYHSISVREISRDPDNPRIRTYDIQDSVIGQIHAAFVVDIGFQFHWNIPTLGYLVDYVTLRSKNDIRGYDYDAHDVSVYLRYEEFDSSGMPTGQWVTELVHTYSGTNAAVYPYLIPQSEEIHTVTGGIVTP